VRERASLSVGLIVFPPAGGARTCNQNVIYQINLKQELNSLETSCDNSGGEVKKNDLPVLRRKTKPI
jgi:hypothetical protein